MPDETDAGRWRRPIGPAVHQEVVTPDRRFRRWGFTPPGRPPDEFRVPNYSLIFRSNLAWLGCSDVLTRHLYTVVHVRAQRGI